MSFLVAFHALLVSGVAQAQHLEGKYCQDTVPIAFERSCYTFGPEAAFVYENVADTGIYYGEGSYSLTGDSLTLSFQASEYPGPRAESTAELLPDAVPGSAGQYRFTVRDSDGLPIPGVAISFSSVDEGRASSAEVTDLEGRLTWTAPAEGRFLVEASLTGFAEVSFAIEGRPRSGEAVLTLARKQPAAVIGAGERRQLQLERLGDGRLALRGDGLGGAGEPAVFSRVD